MDDNNLTENNIAESSVTENSVTENKPVSIKMGDNKIKIGIMAGVIALLLVGFAFVFLKNGDSGNTPPPTPPIAHAPSPSLVGKSPAPAGSPMPTANAVKPGAALANRPSSAGTQFPGVKPPVAGKPPLGSMKPNIAGARPPLGAAKPTFASARLPMTGKPNMPTAGMMPGAKPAAQPSGLKPPSLPQIATAKALTTAVFDPFSGGPEKKIKKQIQQPWPALVMVSTVPPVLPQNLDFINSRNNRPIQQRVDPQVGRMAGWIFNNNGQIVAIFEDADGIARSVHVGDKVNDLTVKAITPEYMDLVDGNGTRHKLKLQGLDSYSGPSRTVNVVTTPSASPAAPAWGGQ